MRKAKILKNRASYTTSTESIKVIAQNIKDIVYGMDFLQNGATAPTLATLITHTNTVKLIVGGEVETLVRFDDLFVYNVFMGNKPMYVLPSADNGVGILNNVRLPVRLTTDKDVYVELAYSGLATIDTERLTLAVEYGDVPYPRKPLAFRYITGSTSTSFVEFDISVAGKQLVGLLVYNTTIPTTSAYDFTVGELKLLVKREEKLHIHANAMQTAPVEPEDTTLTGIVDNYRYIDLSDDPIPADDLKVAVKSISSATDSFRIIGVYR